MKINKEPYMVERSREMIPYFVMTGGPLGGFTPFMRRRLKEYREKYQDFDKYLFSLKEFLLKEEYRNYETLIEFIDGHPNGFTIYNHDSIFATMIKLYNLCFSPKQTVSYINKCYDIYQSMLNSGYSLDRSYEVSMHLDEQDGNARKFVTLRVIPDNQQLIGYYFNVTLSTLQTPILLGSNKVELKTRLDIYRDALSLFENAQDERLKYKIVGFVLKELMRRKILTLAKVVINKREYYYQIIDEPGGYYSIDKHLNDNKSTEK